MGIGAVGRRLGVDFALWHRIDLFTGPARGPMVRKTARRHHRGPTRATAAVAEGREPGVRVAPSPARDRRTWLVCAPLVLIVLAAFLPVLSNGFLDWDDEVNFLRNSQYRGLGWPQVRWAWSTFLLGVYQPLAWLLFEVQYVLFGLDPRGYHLTSLLLHAANAVALYALAVALLVRCRPDPFLHSPWARAFGAGLATALYAVHPLRVEAVAWASCQPYLPCTLFALLAVLAYIRAVDDGPSPRWGWLAGSFALSAAAMLCKAAAVGLPAVLVILDIYPLRRLGGGPGRWLGPSARRVWLEKVPFVALGLVFMGLAVAAKSDAHSLSLEDDDLPTRIARACYGTWFYLVKTAIPRDITALYPLPRRLDRYAPPFSLSVFSTLAVSVGLFVLRRRWPGLLAAWLGYLVLLAPSSGLVRIGPHLVADRYSYLAMAGPVVLAAAGLGLAWASSRRARAVAIIAVGAALPVLVVLTWGQCRVWHDSAVLWSHVLDHGGPSPTAHGGLGLALFSRGSYEEAMAHFDEALRLGPDDPSAHNNRASLLATCPEAKYRDGKEAVAAATRACKLTGWSQPILFDTLAAAYAEAGDFGAAVAWQEKAIGLMPDGVEKDDFRTRLALYRAGKPCHDTSLLPWANAANR
jgi:tetratricopeptide (TPR) repeat protein